MEQQPQHLRADLPARIRAAVASLETPAGQYFRYCAGGGFLLGFPDGLFAAGYGRWKQREVESVLLSSCAAGACVTLRCGRGSSFTVTSTSTSGS